MPGMRVRAAREADVPAIARFVPAAVDWATVISALGAVVATDDDAVQGVLVRWPHPAHLLVERLAVAPHARRNGIASALVDVAEREAIESGVNTVRTPAAGGHVPFFRARGYTPSGDGSMLEKRLAP